MTTILKNYLLDFWVWWYWFALKRVLFEARKYWNFTAGYLNIVPMLRNLFRPMFQDNTWEGKLVAIPFRLIWSFFGIIILAIYSILLFTGILIYLLIPILPVLVLLNSVH